jgi:alpha 1,3-glucosidase
MCRLACHTIKTPPPPPPGYEVIQVPCDAIWLDIEHTKDKRYLEWDLQKFPDPINLHRMLELRGRKLVPIVNPHLKRDQDYSLFKEAEEKNLLVRGANGKHWQGEQSKSL